MLFADGMIDKKKAEKIRKLRALAVADLSVQTYSKSSFR